MIQSYYGQEYDLDDHIDLEDIPVKYLPRTIYTERRSRFPNKKNGNIDDKDRRNGLPVNTIVNIQIDDMMKIGHTCGAYVLITKSGRTYVGCSTDIKKRVSHHRTNREYYQDGIESVIVCATENIKDARRLEIILIHDIEPDINTMRYPGKNTKGKMRLMIRGLFVHSRN